VILHPETHGTTLLPPEVERAYRDAYLRDDARVAAAFIGIVTVAYLLFATSDPRFAATPPALAAVLLAPGWRRNGGDACRTCPGVTGSVSFGTRGGPGDTLGGSLLASVGPPPGARLGEEPGTARQRGRVERR